MELETLLKGTEARYAQREQSRSSNLAAIRSGTPLAAGEPQRAVRRLMRLARQESAFRALGGAPVADLSRLGQERVLGESDLVSVSFLQAAFAVARTVARIKVKTPGGFLTGYGTGFLVSPQLLLTNNHVLDSVGRAASSSAEFDYQEVFRGVSATPVEFRLRPDIFFSTDAALDCTFVAIEARSTADGTLLENYGWNKLIEEEGKVALGEKLNIVQHPGGEPKQVALRENQLIDVLPDFLHYQTDTAPGSSGSPVFNDQWEVVALHHSGVPQRNERGELLSITGTVWSKAMGEHRIAWIANEGVRISRILDFLKKQTLRSGERTLRDQLFYTAPPSSSILQAESSSSMSTHSGAGASATLIVPLQITLSLGALPTVSTSVPPEAPASKETPVPPVNAASRADLAQAVAKLRENESEPYYNEENDRAARDAYYSGFDWNRSPEENYEALSALVRSTHTTTPKYKPLIELYPWIDLHPDRQIRSIYSGRSYEPEEFMGMEVAVEAARVARVRELQTREGVSFTDLQESIDALEDSLPYNCEHVVPQSWFNKKEPMRGDLHHLFACESGCNSFRGNIPYYDFNAAEEAIRTECGRREEDKFEPEAGHGAVAGASLYYLLRYPGLIGDKTGEFPVSRLETILQWHKDDPPGEYEKHRNQAIFARQGNRNPLVDFPAKVDGIAFRKGFGSF
jgi:endonuclease G